MVDLDLACLWNPDNMDFSKGATVDFFQLFRCSICCNMTKTSLLSSESMSVSSKTPKELISVFCFLISSSPGQLILISSSISISSFNELLIFKLFSEHIVSFKPTRKGLPLICLYWPKSLSKGSLWKRTVNMKSGPLSNKSSIKLAWQLKVRVTKSEWIVQMMGPSHYISFKSNLQVHDKILASRHYFFFVWPKIWSENWNLE